MIEKIRFVVMLTGGAFSLFAISSLVWFWKARYAFEERAYIGGFCRNIIVALICWAIVYVLGGK